MVFMTFAALHNVPW